MSDSPSFVQVSSVVDRLHAGETVLETDPVVLILGQNLARGSLLGKITASGKWTLSLSAAVDGSQVPRSVLAHDTNATAADNNSTPVYLSGTFNQNFMTFGTGHTAASVKDALADVSIYLKDVQVV